MLLLEPDLARTTDYAERKDEAWTRPEYALQWARILPL